MKIFAIKNTDTIKFSGVKKDFSFSPVLPEPNCDKFSKNNFTQNPIAYINTKLPDTKNRAVFLENVCNAIAKSDDNARNIIALVDYISKNNMPPEILMDLSQNPIVNEALLDDFNASVDIPVLSSREALEELKDGDIFVEHNDDMLSMKVAKNRVERFKISPQVYLELFSPVKRHIVSQGLSYDCYLLSVINTLMNRPDGFSKILKCLEQDGDDLLVKFANGSYTHTFKDAKLPKNADMSRLSKGCDGVKIFECAYSDELEKAAQYANRTVDLKRVNSLLPDNIPKYENAGDYLRDLSGSARNFMDCMGIKDIKMYNLSRNVPFVKNMARQQLANPKVQEDGIFIGCKNVGNGAHAYVIEPFNQGSKTFCKVYNSSNASFYTKMDLDETENYFDGIYTGKLN